MADTDGGTGGNVFLIYDLNTLWQIAHGDSPENLAKRADQLERRGTDLVDRAKRLRNTIKLLDGHYHSPKGAPAMFQTIRDRADLMNDVGSALLGAGTLTGSAADVLAETQRQAKKLFENRPIVILNLSKEPDITAEQAEGDVNEYLRLRLAKLVQSLNNSLYEFATGYPTVPDVRRGDTTLMPDGPGSGDPGREGAAYSQPGGSGSSAPAATGTPPMVPVPPGGWIPTGRRSGQGGAIPGSPGGGAAPGSPNGSQRPGAGKSGLPGTIGDSRRGPASTAPVGRILGGRHANAVSGGGRPVADSGAAPTRSGPSSATPPAGPARANPQGGPGPGGGVPPGGMPGTPSGAGGGRDRRQRRTWYEKIEDEFKALEGSPPGGEVRRAHGDTTSVDPGPGVLGEQKTRRPAQESPSQWGTPPAPAPEGFPDELKSFTKTDGTQFEVRRRGNA